MKNSIGKKIDDLMKEIKEKLSLKEIEFEKQFESDYYFRIKDSSNNIGRIRFNESTGYLQEKFNDNWRRIQVLPK